MGKIYLSDVHHEPTRKKLHKLWLKQNRSTPQPATPIQRSFLQDADEVGNTAIRTHESTEDTPSTDPPKPADWLTGNLSGILQSIVRNHPPERRHVALRDALSRMGLKRHELHALQLAIKLELSQ